MSNGIETMRQRRGAGANLNLNLFSFFGNIYITRVCYAVSVHSPFITHIHFSVTRVGSMFSNCLTTTLPVECVCCSWSSLNASPYPGATVCIINVSLNTAKIEPKL